MDQQVHKLAAMRRRLILSPLSRDRQRGGHRWEHDDTLGWAALALGGVNVIPITGHHLAHTLPPHVLGLAGQIRLAIQRARAA